ncbi:MAG: EamA family transporter [Lachnospiraceae bacterium]|nr:EamA family transporter [Lachnospiraceae bacterium]
MWITFAFGSAFFAGITAILAKVGMKQTDSSLVTAIRTIVVVIFSWMMVGVTGSGQGIAQIDRHSLLFLVLSGMSTGASWLCYFKALQLGDVNKVTPIDKSSTVLTMILAVIFLHESLTKKTIFAMVLILAGTLLMITKKDSSGRSKGKGWFLFAVLSALFASLTSILGKVGIRGVDSTLGTAIRTCVVLVMAWLVVFVTHKQKEFSRITFVNGIFICLSGVSTGASWLCYYRALQEGPASIVVPIDKLSIVITVAFSSIFLNEKLTPKAFFGLLAIVGGTLLLII